MTVEEKLEKLTDTVAAHDRQIAALFAAFERTDNLIARNAAVVATLADATRSTQEAVASLGKQWQAYINTLPRQ